MNSTNLKSSKFHKIMTDSMIIHEGSSPLEKKMIDIMFCQVNKHKANMNFNNFLHLLTKISEFKYP